MRKYVCRVYRHIYMHTSCGRRKLRCSRMLLHSVSKMKCCGTLLFLFVLTFVCICISMHMYLCMLREANAAFKARQ